MAKKKEVKKAPMTLFGMQIRHNPEAHKLSVALAMSGLNVDIPTADLILKVFNKVKEMGGKFDLHTATSIHIKTVEEYKKLEELHKSGKK